MGITSTGRSDRTAVTARESATAGSIRMRFRVTIVPSVVRVEWLFFFQAEDGIRDLTVTGVQTCALPIWLALQGPPLDALVRAVRHRALATRDDRQLPRDDALVGVRPVRDRGSEEREFPYLDHDAVDAAGECIARDQPRYRVRACGGRRRSIHRGQSRRRANL